MISRRQPVLDDLGHHVLEKTERQIGNLQLRVSGENPIRVLRGSVAVHQHERDLCSHLLSQRQHLASDKIEEGQISAHWEQGLRAVEAHGGPEASVELDHRRACDGRPAGLEIVVEGLGIW